MSVTTTANPITYTIQSTLQDYDIHVTGHIDNAGETNNDAILSSSAAVQNPSQWPRDHHRIPDYRPINRHLSLAERPNGSNAIERTFLLFMFTGVALNAGMAQTWGSTGGRIFTKVFRYAIGGEW